MGATNRTTNYNLSQFIGTDKPSWLNDYNGDMNLIDSAIKSAADDASAASTLATNASSTATSAANTANSLSTQINAPVTGLAAVVAEQTSDITALETLCGNTPLDTTATTLTGAINEIKASVPSISGAFKLVNSGAITKTYDGSLTMGQAMDSIYTDLVALFGTLTANQYIKIVGGTPSQYVPLTAANDTTLHNTIPASYEFYYVDCTGANAILSSFKFSTASSYRYASGSFTVQDNTSTPGAGQASLSYEIYEIEA